MSNFIKDVENALLNNDVSLKEIMRSHCGFKACQDTLDTMFILKTIFIQEGFWNLHKLLDAPKIRDKIKILIPYMV